MSSILDILEASKYITENSRWYDTSVYHTLTDQRGHNLCSYSPSSGPNEGLFCGKKAVFVEGSFHDYRCELCKSKTGNNIKVLPRWVSLEYYFSSYNNLCSYIPKDGDNYGNICGLPAVKTECDKKDYRCELCISKDSNVVLYNSYLEINKETQSKKRKLTEERWIPTSKYIKKQIDDPDNHLCSFSPTNKDRVDLHCGGTAVIGVPGCFWEYRCSHCRSKKSRNTVSIFMKHLLKQK